MLNRKGVSLVELVVAMALFAIIVPSILYALESAMHLNLFSDKESDATYIAQAELENINALGANNTLGDVFTTLTYSSTCSGGFNYCKSVDGIDYNVIVTAANASTLLNSVLLEVTNDNSTVNLQLYIQFEAE